MNPSRALLLRRSLLALAAVCGLECALSAHAQLASPPPGKALIVLYRSDKQPVAAKVPVIANADRLGELGNGEFVNVVVNPGRTFLRAGDRILTTLAIQTAANQRYYVLVQAVPNQTPVRVEMREMPEATARPSLAQSRPIGTGPVAAVPVPRAPAVAAAAAPLAAAPRPAPPAAAPPRPAPQAAAPPPPTQPRRFSTIAREPPPPEEEEDAEAELRKWRFALIAKTGTFKLGSTSQTLAQAGGGTLTITYDKSSKPVAGFEAEFRHQDGFAVGAEVFYYKNDLIANPGAFSADQTVVSGMLNGKYYFHAADWLYPFIGAGAGFTAASYGGQLQGNAGGPGFQGMVGVDVRFRRVGLYVEYKYLSSTTSNSANQKIKVGGSGILAGVSIAF